MKKFLIVILLVNTFISTPHTMKANSPVDMRKQYDNLKTLIHKADVEAFKIAFDELASVEKRNVGLDLEQVIVETKTAINEEIKALGDTNKNWSTIIKGGLASIGGFVGGISGTAGLMCALDRMHIIDLQPSTFNSIAPFAELACGPIAAFDWCKGGLTDLSIVHKVIVATSALYLVAAYKGLTYGAKTFKAGLHHKQRLQNQLANLDAIAAHISQTHAYVMEDEIQHLHELGANPLL